MQKVVHLYIVKNIILIDKCNLRNISKQCDDRTLEPTINLNDSIQNKKKIYNQRISWYYDNQKFIL